MVGLLIDTDILIDVANSDTVAVDRLRQKSRDVVLAVSSITVMELVVGAATSKNSRS